MKDRVQVWMKREDFVELRRLLDGVRGYDGLRKAALDFWEDELGPFMPLMEALEAASCSSANHEEEGGG